MSDQHEEDVNNWLFQMKPQEMNETLHQLSLKADGDQLEKMVRLKKWLQGYYTAADFEQTADEDEVQARIKRERSRVHFIDEVCQEQSGSTILEENYDKDLPHPLSIFKDAPIRADPKSAHHSGQARTQELGEESAQEDVRAPHNRPHGGRPGEKEINRADQNADDLQQMKSMFAQLLDYQRTLHTRLDELSAQVAAELQQRPTPPASSTRVEERDAQRNENALRDHDSLNTTSDGDGGFRPPRGLANYRDTLIRHGVDSSSPRNTRGPDGTSGTQEQSQPDLASPRLDGVRGRGDTSRSGQLVPDASTGEAEARGAGRDLCQIVSRRNLKFSGGPAESVDLFLSKVEEMRRSANLTEADLLASLPMLLSDVAYLWYDSYKSVWRSWTEFCLEARERWGSRLDLQERLRNEAQQRYQQTDEPVRVYMTCLESMLLKLEPRPPKEKVIEALHDNMLPELKRLVRREDCRSVNELITRAVKAELALEREAGDRTPIPPSSSVMPEAAYQPSKSGGRRTKHKDPPAPVIAATKPDVARSEKNPEADLMREMRDMVASLCKRLKESEERAKRESRGPKRSPNRRYGRGKSSARKKSPSTERNEKGGDKSGRRSPNRRSPGRRGSSAGSNSRECYGCGRPDTFKRDCPNCSGNGSKRT